ncbi:hypothetical protein GQX74_011906 [Glossina fuscipes]|nr:hypothetical protein GQX74_011906 [Glossina fuscipes]
MCKLQQIQLSIYGPAVSEGIYYLIFASLFVKKDMLFIQDWYLSSSSWSNLSLGCTLKLQTVMFYSWGSMNTEKPKATMGGLTHPPYAIVDLRRAIGSNARKVQVQRTER